MRGNLLWSYRTQTAKFVEDDNGKFQIVDGQIEPIIKEKVIDNSKQISHLIRLQEETKRIAEKARFSARNAESHAYHARYGEYDSWY